MTAVDVQPSQAHAVLEVQRTVQCAHKHVPHLGCHAAHRVDLIERVVCLHHTVIEDDGVGQHGRHPLVDVAAHEAQRAHSATLHHCELEHAAHELDGEVVEHAALHTGRRPAAVHGDDPGDVVSKRHGEQAGCTSLRFPLLEVRCVGPRKHRQPIYVRTGCDKAPRYPDMIAERSQGGI